MKKYLWIAISASVCWVAQGARACFAEDTSPGMKAFHVCAACHTTDGAKKIGPTLEDIIGRKAGSVAGFHYSHAMKSANIVWGDETLDAYLAAPQKLIPGNTMPFSGLPSAKERADLIAYLHTLK